jgi:prolyl-tRNA editing enzyme YbaK/EbsC (Cys-tRNA(Pro) deacylase)
MQCKDRLESYLRGNEVPFQVQHHVRAFTAQEIASTEHIPGKLVAKVVMVIANGKTVMLALPASHRVDLAAVRTYLEAADVRLAHESEFAETFPDCEVGAMPPFGNLFGVPVRGRHVSGRGRHHRRPGRHAHRHLKSQVRRLRAACSTVRGGVRAPSLGGLGQEPAAATGTAEEDASTSRR